MARGAHSRRACTDRAGRRDQLVIVTWRRQFASNAWRAMES
jgi:hypothetical protein